MTPFLRKIFHEQRIAQDFASIAQVAGPIVGGLIGQDAASSAAEAQAQASAQASQATLQAQREANQLQKYIYDTSRADQLPYLQRGNAAGNALQNLLGLGTQQFANPAANQEVQRLARQNAQNSAIQQVAAGWGLSADQVMANPGAAAEVSRLTADYQPTEDQLSAARQQVAAGWGNPELDSSYGSLMRRFTTADLQNDVPYQQGFQYALDQGQLGVNRLAAASGSLNSGATLKALQDRAANVANQYAGDAYNRFTSDQTNQYNRLAGISGAGQQAANSLASTGANYANAGTSTALSTGNALSNLYTGAGNSRAASSIAGGNALSGGLNSISNFYQTQNLLSSLGGAGNSSSLLGNSWNLAGAFS